MPRQSDKQKAAMAYGRALGQLRMAEINLRAACNYTGFPYKNEFIEDRRSAAKVRYEQDLMAIKNGTYNDIPF